EVFDILRIRNGDKDSAVRNTLDESFRRQFRKRLPQGIAGALEAFRSLDFAELLARLELSGGDRITDRCCDGLRKHRRSVTNRAISDVTAVDEELGDSSHHGGRAQTIADLRDQLDGAAARSLDRRFHLHGLNGSDLV